LPEKLAMSGVISTVMVSWWLFRVSMACVRGELAGRLTDPGAGRAALAWKRKRAAFAARS